MPAKNQAKTCLPFKDILVKEIDSWAHYKCRIKYNNAIWFV
jgi:hypothetical protein